MITVVFEGGGAAGIGYGGTYGALEKLELLPKINVAAGSSIGALFALLISLGIDSKRAIQRILRVNFRDFIHTDPDKIYKLQAGASYLTQWGIFPADPIFTYVRSLIAEEVTLLTGKKSTGDETFLEIYNIRKCHLLVTATNLNKGMAVYLSDKHSPDLQAYWGVAMSMVVPQLYHPVLWNGDLWCDGGVGDNLPYRAALAIEPKNTIFAFAFDLRANTPANDGSNHYAIAADSNITNDNNKKGELSRGSLTTLVDYNVALMTILSNNRGCTMLRAYAFSDSR